jgi:hypothetical protein
MQEDLDKLAALDPIEAMLAIQVIAANAAAMDAFGLAFEPGTTAAPALRQRVNAASLMGTMTRAMRLLAQQRATPGRGLRIINLFAGLLVVCDPVPQGQIAEFIGRGANLMQRKHGARRTSVRLAGRCRAVAGGRHPAGGGDGDGDRDGDKCENLRSEAIHRENGARRAQMRLADRRRVQPGAGTRPIATLAAHAKIFAAKLYTVRRARAGRRCIWRAGAVPQPRAGIRLIAALPVRAKISAAILYTVRTARAGRGWVWRTGAVPQSVAGSRLIAAMVTNAKISAAILYNVRTARAGRRCVWRTAAVAARGRCAMAGWGLAAIAPGATIRGPDHERRT